MKNVIFSRLNKRLLQVYSFMVIATASLGVANGQTADQKNTIEKIQSFETAPEKEISEHDIRNIIDANLNEIVDKTYVKQSYGDILTKEGNIYSAARKIKAYMSSDDKYGRHISESVREKHNETVANNAIEKMSVSVTTDKLKDALQENTHLSDYIPGDDVASILATNIDNKDELNGFVNFVVNELHEDDAIRLFNAIGNGEGNKQISNVIDEYKYAHKHVTRDFETPYTKFKSSDITANVLLQALAAEYIAQQMQNGKDYNFSATETVTKEETHITSPNAKSSKEKTVVENTDGSKETRTATASEYTISAVPKPSSTADSDTTTTPQPGEEGYEIAFEETTADTAPAPTLNDALYNVKEKAIEAFEQGKNIVNNAIAKNDSVKVDSDLQQAIDATKLTERHSKEHLTTMAAKDLLENMQDAIIDEDNLNITYGAYLKQYPDLNIAADSLVQATENSYEIYKSVTADFHTLNSKNATRFVNNDMNPDLKKGNNSGFVKQIRSETNLSKIMPEAEILSAMNNTHIKNMIDNGVVNHDSIASMNRLVGFAAVDLGIGDAQKLFRLIAEGKGDDKLSDHFKSSNAIARNVVKPYDHDNVLNINDITVGDLANLETIKYIIQNAGSAKDNALFTVSKNVVVQTKEEKQRNNGSNKLRAPRKFQRNSNKKLNNTLNSDKLGKTTVYLEFGHNKRLAVYGDPGGLYEKANANVVNVKGKVLGIEHDISNRAIKKPDSKFSQFNITGHIGLMNLTFKEGIINKGWGPIGPAGEKYFKDKALSFGIGANAVIGKNKFGGEISRLTSPSRYNMFHKGNTYLNFYDDFLLKSGQTKRNGNDYAVKLKADATFPMSSQKTDAMKDIYHFDFNGIEEAYANGEYYIPQHSTWSLEASYEQNIRSKRFNILDNSRVKVGLNYGGDLAKTAIKNDFRANISLIKNFGKTQSYQSNQKPLFHNKNQLSR